MAVRHKHPAFGRGELDILTPDNLKVLAFVLARPGSQRAGGPKSLSAFANTWSWICRPTKDSGQSSCSGIRSFLRSVACLTCSLWDPTPSIGLHCARRIKSM